jgi:hypothetical protein
MGERRDRLQARFGEIYPTHVAAFARLLTALRREFDGDLDLLLILTVIGQRRFQQRLAPGALTYENFGAAPSRIDGGATVNAHSLSASTGMPRETVRRKVAVLVERGWIERDARGDLHPTKKGAEELVGATSATLEYLETIIERWDLCRADDRQR